MAVKFQAPPQSGEAEEAILGAILLNNVVLDRIDLEPSDFYYERHGNVFRVARELANRNVPVDAITLCEELDRQGIGEPEENRLKMAELVALMPTTANVEHYARIIRDNATRRALIRTGGEITKLGWDGLDDPDTLVAKASEQLDKLTDSSFKSEYVLLSQIISEFAEEVAEATKSGVARTGLLTGYTDLDKVTLGLWPGTLTVIAARPGMGKSALAQCITENVADKGTPAAFFSLEMTQKELAARSVSRAGKIPLQVVQRQVLDPTQQMAFAGAIKKTKDRKVYSFCGDLTIAELVTQARQLVRTKQIGFLAVDYIQLLRTGRNEESRQYEIAKISRTLKMLALQLDIPVVALSQLSRAVEHRDEKRPTMADLRDSGAIEQDADLILMVYRDDYYEGDVNAQKSGIAEILVKKNRNGVSGSASTVKLTFVGRYTAFYNLAKDN